MVVSHMAVVGVFLTTVPPSMHFGADVVAVHATASRRQSLSVVLLSIKGHWPHSLGSMVPLLFKSWAQILPLGAVPLPVPLLVDTVGVPICMPVAVVFDMITQVPF